MVLRLTALLILALPPFGSANPSAGIPDARQLIVGLADAWDSSRATLWTFERTRTGWEPTDISEVPILLGRNGLAWGKGVLPVPQGQLKREGDGKTPAGYFKIGKIYGYPDHLPAGSSFPYHQVGYYDCWVDDVNNPHYNRHYIAKPGQEPPWFESQRVRLGDYAYKYKIEIRHNSDPPEPGYGSAIFFHIRRGENRPTVGCTSMAESELVRLIQWLRADKNPHYVVLSRAEYERLQESWRLPRIP